MMAKRQGVNYALCFLNFKKLITMKKTLTINLNGTVFHIDEDAYEALSHYLDELTRQLAAEDGSQEILEDIEARICELFAERLRYGMQVVKLYDVKDVIAVMGQPEQIADCPSAANESSKVDADDAEIDDNDAFDADDATGFSATSNMKSGPKRLLRAVDDRVIAGVCAGLGWYTGLDRWIFRALFIATFLLGYGFPLLLYIILWIILPEARTLAQKLQMRGIAPTVENIRQAVNDGVISSNDAQERSSMGVGGRLLMFFGGALLVLMAMVILPIAGFFGAMSMMDISMNSGVFPYGGTSYALSVSTQPLSFYVSIILLIIIPIYALIHGLLWKADKAKPISKVAAWSLGLLWVVALGVMSYQMWN